MLCGCSQVGLFIPDFFPFIFCLQSPPPHLIPFNISWAVFFPSQAAVHTAHQATSTTWLLIHLFTQCRKRLLSSFASHALVRHHCGIWSNSFLVQWWELLSSHLLFLLHLSANAAANNVLISHVWPISPFRTCRMGSGRWSLPRVDELLQCALCSQTKLTSLTFYWVRAPALVSPSFPFPPSALCQSLILLLSLSL